MFIHVLTAVHAVGALACFVMAAGSALSTRFRDGLVVSGGSEQMVRIFGAWTWLFLLFVGLVLAVLAHASWRLRPWAWHLTLVVYGIGVAGSLWQVSIGIREGWTAAVVNAAVVAYAATPGGAAHTWPAGRASVPDARPQRTRTRDCRDHRSPSASRRTRLPQAAERTRHSGVARAGRKH